MNLTLILRMLYQYNILKICVFNILNMFGLNLTSVNSMSAGVICREVAYQ